MRRLRICIYGGTSLDEKSVKLISALAYNILQSTQGIIVTGGFHHSHANPNATSTDVAALEGARRYTTDHGGDLKDYFEAWLPEPVLDMRPDVKGVVRMSEKKDGVAIRLVPGRTPLGRRLAMVAGVDAAITISGKTHTEIVVEQALELGVPVFPIPHAGGDSEELLEKYRRRIAASFDPESLDQCIDKISETMDDDAETAAGAIVKLLGTAKIGKCLVLMPYDDYHNKLYNSEIEPAIEQHMIPLRLDYLPKSEAIYDSFAEAIQSSSAVIADITDLNSNVMYEIGYAHGRGLTPLIYTRDANQLEKLPIYFKTLNVRVVADATTVRAIVDDYLQSMKTSRHILSMLGTGFTH